ncbi:hypothetical protein ACP87_00825 [Pseudomonas oleovorans]|nr:hypothetical protein [Pseudomonas oleovorans]MBN7133185.1 hypothetical protein [Pseudomonas oleovorans]MBN7140392.1 hypothetical protein [Pseudomonas oleovorans]
MTLGFTQGRRLLLDATRISHKQIATAHQINKRKVIHGVNEMNISDATQHPFDRSRYIRIEMNRVDDLNIRKRRSDLNKRCTDTLKPTAEILTPMTGHQNKAITFLQKRKTLIILKA